MKHLNAYLLAFFLSFMFIAASIAQARTISVGIPLTPKEMDPIDLQYLEEWEIYALVHETLVEYHVLTGYRGAIASRWDFNKKDKTIRFQLRPGLRFSNGQSLTANDVAFSLKRILFLDKEKQFTLSRCLPAKVLRNPDQPHPLINVESETAIVLGPTPCDEVLLKELSDASHGIIARASVDRNFRFVAGRPTSGPYTVNSYAEFSLKANRFNWRWSYPELATEPSEIKFVSSPAFANSKKSPIPSVSFFRTADSEVFRSAKAAGYQSVTSLPTMIWYLRPGKQNPKAVRPVIEDLNNRLEKSKVEAWAGNSLERPANSFFPPEMNCDGIDQPTSSPVKSKAPKPKIRLVRHRSGEDSSFVIDLKTAVEDLGYKVDIVQDERRLNVRDSDTIDLYIERQFIGDSTLNVIGMVFLTFKLVPDPDQVIVPALTKLETTEKSNASNKAFKELCQSFHHYFHVPLAHRKYAFLFMEAEHSSVFSKGNGNLLLNKLIKGTSGDLK